MLQPFPECDDKGTPLCALVLSTLMPRRGGSFPWVEISHSRKRLVKRVIYLSYDTRIETVIFLNIIFIHLSFYFLCCNKINFDQIAPKDKEKEKTEYFSSEPFSLDCFVSHDVVVYLKQVCSASAVAWATEFI